MSKVLEASLKTFIPFAQESLGDGQIDLGFFNADVAHIRGKNGKFIEDVMTVLVPLVETVDGEGVTQVMESRGGSSGSDETRLAAKGVEERQGVGVRERSVGMAEEGRIGAGWREGFLSECEIGFEFGSQDGRERDEAIFMELGVPEGEGVLFEIDVTDFEAERFADAQSAGIEGQKQHGERPSQRFCERRGLLQEAVNFEDRVEVWFVGPELDGRDPQGRVIGKQALANEVVEESLGVGEHVVLGSGTTAGKHVNPVEDKAFIEFFDGAEITVRGELVHVAGERGVTETGVAKSFLELVIGGQIGPEEAA